MLLLPLIRLSVTESTPALFFQNDTVDYAAFASYFSVIDKINSKAAAIGLVELDEEFFQTFVEIFTRKDECSYTARYGTTDDGNLLLCFFVFFLTASRLPSYWSHFRNSGWISTNGKKER